MLIRNVITPVLLMVLGTLCVLACMGERTKEHKAIYAILSVALFVLLLFSVGSIVT